jgi:hypothetical protein
MDDPNRMPFALGIGLLGNTQVNHMPTFLKFGG